MSRSFGLKFVIIILTALALVLTVGSTACVVYLGSSDLYLSTPEEVEERHLEDVSWEIAEKMANYYAFRVYGAAPDFHPYLYENYESWAVNEGFAFYEIRTPEGKLLESTLPKQQEGELLEHSMVLQSMYPIVVTESVADSDVPSNTTVAWGEIQDSAEADVTVPAGFWDEARYSYEDYTEYNGTIFHTHFFEGPTYEVTVYLTRQAWSVYTSDYWWAVNTLYSFRYWFIAGVILGVIVFLAGMSYLTWVAGRKRGSEEIYLVGLTRLPLDLYGAAAAGGVVGCCYFTALLLDFAMEGTDINLGLVFLACAAAVVAAFLCVIYYYAVVTQIKKGGLHWWRNSIVGRLLKPLWLGLRALIRGICTVLSMLPVVWQWMLTAMVLTLGLIITTTQLDYGWEIPFLLWLCVIVAVVFYVAYAFGILMKGAKRMARGDLTRKVPTKFLIGIFRDSANQLNALADVAVVAARNQLKSERMKTELITNVSHDIKTPLTSIINFVDLLRKPHTEQQEAEYLAVLDRQSQRLKKLIEDLMELSKATTGNLQVSPQPMDACEAVHQALGEFSDKLTDARLTPVVRQPEGPAPILADGRLVWRVMSNVLSNVVKYALPGTRIYVDVVWLEGRVLVSLKNISREQLNVSAEELMERFVRGDTSRNTEGSGLGLNIARSLMEVQGGQLQLLVDGDLFKVTLLFPGA